MSRIWVVGSANVDLVVHAPRFPSPGETLLGGVFEEHPGGKGANQACAAALLGGDVSFVGCVGDDELARLVRQALRGCGVDDRYVKTATGLPTGVGSIWVDSEGRNQIIVASGANHALTPEDVHAALEGSTHDDVVVCQLEIATECVEAASRHGRFFLNPAPAGPVPEGALSRAFVATPNEHEAEALSGIAPKDEPSAREAAAWFLDRGVDHVVLTLGARGCLWVNDRTCRHYPALPVRAVDTTAAGDAFSGALARFYAADGDIARAIQLANAAAGLSVTRRGAIPSLPRLEELEAALARA